jgi:RNA polymerase sigma factor (sigma-70 family)
MNDDMTLVREYAAHNSEAAFATLISRHVSLVHSAALRQVRDPHLAGEITQTVFIILARKAGSLDAKTILPGWLYRTANYVSAAALKIQYRRERREQKAYVQAMIQETQTDSTWKQLSPQLDGAMAQLRDGDRDVLVLRFFQNKNFKEVGDALGVEERTAQKRVARALEKLRAIFAKRGVALATTIIAGAVSANSVQAAPAALTKTITAVAMTKGVAASGSTLTLVKGALKIMAWTKIKTAVTVGLVILAGAATTKLVIHHKARKPDASSSPTSIQSKIDPDPFTNEGYQTPQAAVKTMLWAMHNGDWSSYVASSTPKQVDNLEHDKRGRTREQLFAQAKDSVATVTGIQILDQKDISADEAVLTIHLDGEGKARVLGFKKIGDDWKFDQMIGVVLMPASPVNR